MLSNPAIRCQLLLALALSLLPVGLLAEQSIVENRLLRVQDGATQRQYTVPELVAAIGLTELRVPVRRQLGWPV